MIVSDNQESFRAPSPKGKLHPISRKRDSAPKTTEPKKDKDRKLFFQSVSRVNYELCIGFGFRLRSPSYDGTGQR